MIAPSPTRTKLGYGFRCGMVLKHGAAAVMLEEREIERLVVFVAPVLQLRVCFRVGRYKRRRGDAKHVLSELLVIEQLGTGYSHQLEADGSTPSLTHRECQSHSRKD